VYRILHILLFDRWQKGSAKRVVIFTGRFLRREKLVGEEMICRRGVHKEIIPGGGGLPHPSSDTQESSEGGEGGGETATHTSPERRALHTQTEGGKGERSELTGAAQRAPHTRAERVAWGRTTSTPHAERVRNSGWRSVAEADQAWCA
jgi:hypothetical protein